MQRRLGEEPEREGESTLAQAVRRRAVRAVPSIIAARPRGKARMTTKITTTGTEGWTGAKRRSEDV